MKKSYEKPILSVVSLITEEYMTSMWDEGAGGDGTLPQVSAGLEDW
jgi:hypothetical protein